MAGGLVHESHRLAPELARAAVKRVSGWFREVAKLTNAGRTRSARNLSLVGGRWLLAPGLGLLMLTGCSQEPQREPDNWAELCKKADCEQYPAGYSTLQIDGLPTLYFPLLAPDLGLTPDWLQRAKSDGSVVRSLTTNINIGYITLGASYPKEFMKSLGLFQQWPKAIDFPFEIIVYVEKKQKERFWFGENTRAEVFLGDRPDKGVVAAFLSSDMTNYQSLNGDFTIIYQSTSLGERASNKSKFRRFGIFSKEPLVQGKHVIGLCSEVCIFFTVSDGDNQKDVHLEYSFGPMFDFGRLNMKPSIPSGSEEMILTAVECDAPNPLVTCDRIDQAFKDMPLALGLLDQMIDATQQKPKPAEGAIP